MIGAMKALLLLSLIALPAAFAQSEPKPIPRTVDGKPDFQGFWNVPYVPNMSGGKEETVPYTDAGRAAFIAHDSKDDPTANCWYPGVPRVMQSPYPMQIVQTKDYLVMVFEYMRMHRSIPLNNRPHPKDMEPSFMGDSTAHWEDDTLVIDTVSLKDAPWTWLDTAGHQHSDQLHVIEKLRRMPESISYEFTVIDPKMYTKPWTLERKMTPLKINPNLGELIEYSCEENNKDLSHLVSTKPASKQ
jgi:hypothetical protein